MKISDLAKEIKPFVQRWLDGALSEGARDLGTVGQPFETVYANTITADTVTGTMTGSEWETTGNATIDANQASTTTVVYVVNQASGGTANLDVEGNIVVGGTVDGVDVAAHKTAYDAHVAATGTSVHGLGTISTQAASSVNITGGSITGITDLAVADGGTGASTASGARTNLGLGTGDSPQFTAINLGHASDTTIARVSAGLISVEGVTVTLNTATQTLTNKTLTTPTIASFVNAQHNHSNAAGGGTIAHSVLIGIGANDHHNQSHVLASASGLGADHTVSGLTARQVLRATSATTAAFGAIEDADIPSTIVRTSRTLTAGAGLTGGGDLTANRTFNVGAGTLITVNGDDVALSNGTAQYQVPVTGGTPFTPGWTSLSAFAGNGISFSGGQYVIGAGTLITVGATTVGIAAGTNYQFIGTGSGTAAGWRNVSELAGAGLTAASGILAVGAGAGITVNADDVALTTPGTLTASTSNSSSGNHTHAITTGAASTLSVSTSNSAGSSASLARADHLHTITSSSNPGAAASLLATDGSGRLNVAVLGVGGFPGGSDRFNVTGHATLDSADFDGAVTIDDDLSVVYGGYYPLYVNVNTVTPGNSNVGIMKNNPDDQFALDIFGSMRVDGGWIVGKHALQLADAEMIVHFDGPTPFETNYSGFSAGHMGQVGTETGGIIYRPGKFGKAVQVAGATTNRILNPSCETNVTGYYSDSTGDTLVQSSEQAYIGTYSAKWTWGSGTTNFYYNQSGTLANDTTFTVTIHAKRADGAAVSGVSMYIDSTLSTITPTITEVENGWYRIVGTRTITGAPGNHVVGLIGLTTTTSWYFDAWQVEARAYATPYCDGSLGSGHSWSGTAHASTSSRTGATLRYANSLDVEIGTIALWVWHESNTTAGMGLFGTGANTQFDAYVDSAGAVYFRMAGVNLKSPANVVMRQWNHYAFTWSKADNARKIYLNGVEVASRQYDAGAIMDATLYALSLTAGSQYTINGYGDEFVHLRRAADADEIRAIYESNAPVFAESSNFAFRAPSRSAVWVDEEGLWMRSYSGNDTFGIYAADATKSWGGLTLYDSDLAIGNSTAGYVHWHSGVDSDDTTYYGNPALQIAARLHVKDNSTFDGVISIGSSGGVYQGTGTFASPTTGLKIWNDSGVGRIGGYNGGAIQWYGATDGKLYAGAGAVTLDANGISITAGTGAANRISWATAGLQKGSLNVQTLANENYLFVNASGTDATDAQGRLYLSASPYNVAHKGARIEVYSAVSTSGTLHYGEAHHFYPAAGGSSLLTVDSSGVTTGQVNADKLRLADTNASHDLIIASGSDLTADRTLTLMTGDADRTLTLSGNLTVPGTGTALMASYANIGYLDVSSYVKAGASVTAIATVAEGDILTGNASGTLQYDASGSILYQQRSSDNANAVTYLARKSRGTTASPTAVTTGDDLLYLRVYGHDGTSFVESSRMQFDTEGTISAGVVPGLLRFYTASSAGTLTERASINSSGNFAVDTNVLFVDAVNNRIGVVNSSPSYPLDVTGALRATGAAYLTDIRPVSDSTTAVQVKQAGGTAFVTFDSTNKRVGINRTPTGYDFEVTGNVYFDGKLYAGAGAVTLDANGISLAAGTSEPNTTTWKQGGTKLVEHWGYRSGASSPYMTYHQIFAKAFDASSRGTIDLWAYYGASNVAGISLVAWSATDKRVNLLGTTAQWNGTDIGLFRPLTAPLTSTSWDGDSFSTVSTSTLIDLSAVFGAPGGIKAVLAAVTLRDSAAWGSGEYWLGLGPSSTYFYAGTASCYGGDLNGRAMLVIPCDSNGDIYYRTNASGANTLDIYMRIWGYWY